MMAALSPPLPWVLLKLLAEAREEGKLEEIKNKK
jgi:hypothetical protein